MPEQQTKNSQTKDALAEKEQTSEQVVQYVLAMQSTFEGMRQLTDDWIRAQVKRRIEADAGEFDDLVENAYRRIWAALQDFDAAKYKRPWGFLATKINQTVIDHARKRGKAGIRQRAQVSEEDGEREEIEWLPDDGAVAAGVRLEQDKARQRLREALAHIQSPRRLMILLLLSCWEDITNEEIGKIMKLEKIDAVRQLKCNALEEIREILDRRGWGEDEFRCL
jgi:RNA polymerase sigma factor (sigma-70 family)